MRVIEPMTITDAVLTVSNVPETDHAAWDVATAYTTGQRVILTSTHRVYEAIAASTGQNPATDDGTYWLEVGATNRWKAFDGRISDQTSRAGGVTYTLAPGEIVDGMALFGLDAASVRLVVKDPTTATVFDRTLPLVDRTEAVDWFSWLYDPVAFDTEALFTGFPGFVGNTLEITVASSGTTKVGQIVTGRITALGTTVSGTSIGFTDYSRKERDSFGRPLIVQRDIADRTEFQFSFPPDDARRVKRVVSRLRATAAVYFAGEVSTGFGTTVFGFNSGIDIPLEAGACFATMEVEGLV
jgi:hypothetical protein